MLGFVGTISVVVLCVVGVVSFEVVSTGVVVMVDIIVVVSLDVVVGWTLVED